MPDLFISYAREDRNRVRPLADALAAHGWSVWWDRQIQAGRTFDEVIAEALATARCVLVVWSKDSIGSSWVREEAEEGSRRKILIPVLIDDVRPPLGFGRIQAADLREWNRDVTADAFVALLADITRLLGPPESGDEQAATPPSTSAVAPSAPVPPPPAQERNDSAKSRVRQSPSTTIRWLLAGSALALLIVFGLIKFGPGRDSNAQPPPLVSSSPETALRVYAVLTRDGEKVQSGVRYEVYDAAKDAEGKRKSVASSSPYEGPPKFALSPGRYVVSATYGSASASTEIDIAAKTIVLQTLNLRAGVLKLSSVLAAGSSPLTSGVRYEVFEWKKDVEGNRKEIASSSKYEDPPRFALSAGKYFVSATYGSASSRADIEVAPGQTVIRALELNAGVLSLSTILGAGTEPLMSGVEYEVFDATKDPEGNRKHIAGSSRYEDPPRFPLPAGRYVVTAKYGAASTNIEIDMRAGATERRVLNLRAGVLALSTVTAGNQPLAKGVAYDVYEYDKDVEGNRKRVTGSSRYEDPPRLPVPLGRYYITASADSGKGEADVAVTEGQLQQVQLRLTAK
jgi:hypothetical protein